MPFTEGNLRSPAWQNRDAAVLAFASVLNFDPPVEQEKKAALIDYVIQVPTTTHPPLTSNQPPIVSCSSPLCSSCFLCDLGLFSHFAAFPFLLPTGDPAGRWVDEGPECCCPRLGGLAALPDYVGDARGGNPKHGSGYPTGVPARGLLRSAWRPGGSAPCCDPRLPREYRRP